MGVDAKLEVGALPQKKLQPTNSLWKTRLRKGVLASVGDRELIIHIKSHGNFEEAVRAGCVAPRKSRSSRRFI
ncbi:MAG TPA: hypothetical protein DIS96_14595 [Pusillimonas sp.]|nr:hypothetical protein [Pusillimonas sp.]